MEYRLTGISIYSKKSYIFSIKSGVVENVYTIEETSLITVKNGDTAIVYGHIDNPLKKVGDTVRVGEFLGKMKKSIIEDKYELLFLMLVEKKEISQEDYIGFLIRFR